MSNINGMLEAREETSIRFYGEWTGPEADRLNESFLDAIGICHKLPDHIRYMDGMSGKKYRYLINNLIHRTPDARYLEIGSWKGSTACSAIYGNQVKATCIDNWSDFGGPKDEFLSNIEKAKNDSVDFRFIESDFRRVDYSSIGKYNIYMFDGPHLEQDQYDGVFMVQEALDDVYTLIVDDFNQPEVQRGTLRAIEDLGHTIVAQIMVATLQEGYNPKLCYQYSDWHNGYFIGVVKKQQVDTETK